MDMLPDILTDKVYSVLRVAEKYRIDYKEDYDSEEELEKNIPSKKQVKEYLTNDRIQLINKFSTYKTDLQGKKYVEDILKDIDEIVCVIERMDEIISKY